MESSLELCRAVNNREGMIVVLSNLGCLYNLLERSHYAVGHFQECFDLLEGDPSGQGEAQVWPGLSTYLYPARMHPLVPTRLAYSVVPSLSCQPLSPPAALPPLPRPRPYPLFPT